jgi:protein-tyrosine kinase
MDQLRKALDLSKQANTNSTKGKEYNWTASARHRPESLAALDIEYEQTRVVELDQDLLERNRVLCGREPQEIEQAYKLLRTQVLQRLLINDWNSFAVVSPQDGNGRSLTAINLAISLAKEVKQSILLVDLDFRAPKLAQYLGIKLEKDISDYLFEEAQLSEVMINPGMQRLVLLGGSSSLNHTSEILSSPRLIRLVDELKTRYSNRIVIFDLPPMLSYDDAIAFAPHVDAMLMVVEEGRTTPEDLERCAEQLGDKPLLGTVLNKGGA